jgi:hypothetical protein
MARHAPARADETTRSIHGSMRERIPCLRSMKNIPALLFLCLLSPIALFGGPDRLSSLRRDASTCMGAWNSGNLPLFVSCLSERAVPDARARSSVISQIRESYIFGNTPVESVRISLGRIDPPRKFKTLYASVFPVFGEISQLGFKISDMSYALGVSRDSGKSWKFIPLIDYDQGLLDRQFPEFGGQIVVPETSTPSVEVDS